MPCAPARVIIADETCIWFLPSRCHTNGAQSAARQARFVHRRRPSLVLSQLPMDAAAPLYSQLIIGGKTDSCRPNSDGVSGQVFFSHTESHWQTVFSFEACMLILDSKRGGVFKAKVPNHIHIVYILAQATSYCQFCDLAIFKAGEQ